jgi:hypothetical protein
MPDRRIKQDGPNGVRKYYIGQPGNRQPVEERPGYQSKAKGCYAWYGDKDIVRVGDRDLTMEQYWRHIAQLKNGLVLQGSDISACL